MHLVVIDDQPGEFMNVRSSKPARQPAHPLETPSNVCESRSEESHAGHIEQVDRVKTMDTRGHAMDRMNDMTALHKNVGR